MENIRDGSDPEELRGSSHGKHCACRYTAPPVFLCGGRHVVIHGVLTFIAS